MFHKLDHDVLNLERLPDLFEYMKEFMKSGPDVEDALSTRELVEVIDNLTKINTNSSVSTPLHIR